MELKSLQTAIRNEFAFEVLLANLTSATWEDYSAQIGAAIDPPPTAAQTLTQSAPLEKAIDRFNFTTIVFDIPDGYQATGGRFTATVTSTTTTMAAATAHRSRCSARRT